MGASRKCIAVAMMMASSSGHAMRSGVNQMLGGEVGGASAKGDYTFSTLGFPSNPCGRSSSTMISTRNTYTSR